jgi:hypothetical protein
MEVLMTDAAQHQLIRDIAHELIAQIAPRELPLFGPASAAFFNPDSKPVPPSTPRDEMLGFGPDTAITFLTPVVLALTTEAVKFLMEKVKESIKEASGELITKWVKKIFNTEERAKNTPLALSREELVQLRQLMVETAKHLRLPNDKTELLVNTIVGQLALADA